MDIFDDNGRLVKHKRDDGFEETIEYDDVNKLKKIFTTYPNGQEELEIYINQDN
jgi:YD repeat-containing protein